MGKLADEVDAGELAKPGGDHPSKILAGNVAPATLSDASPSLADASRLFALQPGS
jgi:hypothetical protein